MTAHLDSMRRDARRNYLRLLKTAETLFSLHGTVTTLEAVAKAAGVGIGTLYRHFPTRRDLLEAVYADRLEDLVRKAHDSNAANPLEAITEWLEMTIEYSAAYGGFSDLLSLEAHDSRSPLITAGSTLLHKAQEVGAVRADVTIFDLLQLVSGISASGGTPHELTHMRKLLSVVLAGLHQR